MSGRLRLADVFSNGMVMQRGYPAPVFGRGTPGKTVTVRMGHDKKNAKIGVDGDWRVCFDAPPEHKSFCLSAECEREQVEIRGLLAGELWFCAGQSNMEWLVSQCSSRREDLADCEDEQIRLFTVPKMTSEVPRENIGGSWKRCTADTLKDFSAVGYFFGKILRWELNCPVGLVCAAYGGTPIRSWIPEESFKKKNCREKRIFEKFKKFDPDLLKTSRDLVEKYYEKLIQSRSALKPPPEPPEAHLFFPLTVNRYSGLYNAMVHPWVRLPFAGVIWYQGEQDASEGSSSYERDLLSLVKLWRKAMGKDKLPFHFVQLANFTEPTSERMIDLTWPEIRHDLLKVGMDLPGCSTIPAIDGIAPKEAWDIHPPDKRIIGKRLVDSALRENYGFDRPGPGAVAKSVKKKNASSVVVCFVGVSGGLRSRGKLKEFEVSGTDGVFHPAGAEITASDEVTVTAPEGMKGIKKIRYAWRGNPVARLFDADGYPVFPFSL